MYLEHHSASQLDTYLLRQCLYKVLSSVIKYSSTGNASVNEALDLYFDALRTANFDIFKLDNSKYSFTEHISRIDVKRSIYRRQHLLSIRTPFPILCTSPNNGETLVFCIKEEADFFHTLSKGLELIYCFWCRYGKNGVSDIFVKNWISSGCPISFIDSDKVGRSIFNDLSIGKIEVVSIIKNNESIDYISRPLSHNSLKNLNIL